MSSAQLEHILRDFSRRATLQQRDHAGGREIWRFEWNGKPYLLYFYERGGRLARLGRANRAHRHFFGLQALQKLSIPAPRAVAQLAGFRVEDRVGDAVIVESIEPGMTLEQVLIDHALRGEPVPDRRPIAGQVRGVLQRLGQAKLGNSNLSLAGFLVRDAKVYLSEAEHLHRGGMRLKDVMRLGHDAARFATIGELRRAWELLQPGTSMPRSNPLSSRLWQREAARAKHENDAFGILIGGGGWRGVFTKQSRFARRGSRASRVHVSHAEWRNAWPVLMRTIESGAMTKLKDDASGEVLTADVQLAGQSIPVVIKRPRNKFWYRYVLDVFRPSRAARTWIKTWKAIVRGLPTEWPMLLMEKRVAGYTTDAVVVFERIDGTTLDQLDLDALSAEERDTLFRRAGRILRRLERTGLSHMDAKSTNWMVVRDETLGPVPVLIDLFGIRVMTFGRAAHGIRRLLRAMRRHPQYTPADSLSLCRGFAPFSRIEREPEPDPTAGPAAD